MKLPTLEELEQIKKKNGLFFRKLVMICYITGFCASAYIEIYNLLKGDATIASSILYLGICITYMCLFFRVKSLKCNDN